MFFLNRRFQCIKGVIFIPFRSGCVQHAAGKPIQASSDAAWHGVLSTWSDIRLPHHLYPSYCLLLKGLLYSPNCCPAFHGDPERALHHLCLSLPHRSFADSSYCRCMAERAEQENHSGEHTFSPSQPTRFPSDAGRNSYNQEQSRISFACVSTKYLIIPREHYQEEKVITKFSAKNPKWLEKVTKAVILLIRAITEASFTVADCRAPDFFRPASVLFLDTACCRLVPLAEHQVRGSWLHTPLSLCQLMANSFRAGIAFLK